MEVIYWDHYYNQIIILNLMIVIGLFTSLRLFSGSLAHIRASDELLRKDNPAFGISLAATTFAITVMLSGTIYGSPEMDVESSAIQVGLFGVIGIVLMALTRVVFDKLTLPALSLRDEIVGGNLAVAIADAGNVIAAAIIIRTVLIWVTGFTLDGLTALLGGYILSQFILTAISIIKRKAFEMMHSGALVQTELSGGNTAFALRFAGQRIGAALAISTAAHVVVYERFEIWPILGAWFIASLIAVMAWRALSFAAEKIILFRVDVKDEVVRQRNIAVGALQAVVFVSIGLLLLSL